MGRKEEESSDRTLELNAWWNASLQLVAMVVNAVWVTICVVVSLL